MKNLKSRNEEKRRQQDEKRRLQEEKARTKKEKKANKDWDGADQYRNALIAKGLM